MEIHELAPGPRLAALKSLTSDDVRIATLRAFDLAHRQTAEVPPGVMMLVEIIAALHERLVDAEARLHRLENPYRGRSFD